MNCSVCGSSYLLGSYEYPLATEEHCSSICAHLSSHDDAFCPVCEALGQERDMHDFAPYVPLAARMADTIHRHFKHTYPSQGRDCKQCADVALLLFGEFFFGAGGATEVEPARPSLTGMGDSVSIPQLWKEFNEAAF